MTKQMLNGIRVSGKDKLENRIYKYLEVINDVIVPYHWSYSVNDIDLEKEDVSRIIYEVISHKAARAENQDKHASKPKIWKVINKKAVLK